MSDDIQWHPFTLNRTVDALRLGFQVIGFDWTYLYLNPAAARHGRRRVTELVGRTIFEAYPGIEQQEPLISSMRSAMTERRSHSFDNEFTFPDGTKQWFDIRIEPVPEGICVYSLDIHERKLRELARERELEEIRAKRRGMLRDILASLVGRSEKWRTPDSK